jgi:tRNA threonylcarbamoyl adenosine modification protein YeaZ
MQRGHAERLPMMVDELLRETGLKASGITRVAVTRGPGTFTGLRIGLSYAKGLGLALSIPVIGVDSLWAMAAPQRGAAKRIAVAHKAGATGFFYAAVFDGHSLEALLPPQLVDAQQFAAWSTSAYVLRDQAPDAAAFGLHALSLDSDTHPAQPLYLREADAKPNAPAQFSSPTTRQTFNTDAQLLAALHAESFQPAWTAEMIASSLSLPGAGAIVVDLANRAYGFVQYQWVAGEAEINTLCVSPNYRGQGFGRALMQALVTHLKSRNTSKLFLEVAADNVAAMALYRHMGFVETGVRKGYYARKNGAVDAITMSLAL